MTQKPGPHRRGVLLGLSAVAAGCGPKVAAAAGVRREDWVEADGARLFLMTRGSDAAAPLLLWLHGGPGGAERPLFRLYNQGLERRFVVAYLDQRGAGRSFDPDADPKRLTIAQHVADLDRAVDHLRRTFRREQVILIGHSWGSALGLIYARDHPAKVAAFLGVGQVTSELARQESQYAFVREVARRRGDAERLRRLDEIGPPPFTAARELATQRLVEAYGGYFVRPPSFPLLLLRGVAGGHVTPWEIPRFLRGNAVSLEAMNDELLGLDLRRSVPAVDTPVAFLLGRHDRQVDSRLAADYFARLSAPAKRLQWFEQSAHNPPFEEPAAFNAAVVRLVSELGVGPRAPGA